MERDSLVVCLQPNIGHCLMTGTWMVSHIVLSIEDILACVKLWTPCLGLFVFNIFFDLNYTKDKKLDADGLRLFLEGFQLTLS